MREQSSYLSSQPVNLPGEGGEFYNPLQVEFVAASSGAMRGLNDAKTFEATSLIKQFKMEASFKLKRRGNA